MLEEELVLRKKERKKPYREGQSLTMRNFFPKTLTMRVFLDVNLSQKFILMSMD